MNIKTKTFHPCFNRVLIKFVRNSDSSIVLPDGKDAIGGRIVVQSVGADVKCCEPGDEIVISRKAEMDGVDEAEKLAIITDDSIIAVVR